MAVGSFKLLCDYPYSNDKEKDYLYDKIESLRQNRKVVEYLRYKDSLNRLESIEEREILCWFASKYRDLAKNNMLVLEDYEITIEETTFHVKITDKDLTISSNIVVRKDLPEKYYGKNANNVVCEVHKTLSIVNNLEDSKKGVSLKTETDFDLSIVTKEDVEGISKLYDEALINFIAYNFVFHVKSKDQ